MRRIDTANGMFFYNLEDALKAMALRPFELHLELTNLCNANCVFCPYQFQEHSTETMPDEVFYKAVSDFIAASGGSVGLTPIVGDALLDPKYLKRVQYLRSQTEIDRIFITTNAILVDRFGARELISSGLTSINISTASFDKENYRAIYRNPSYGRMRDNVLNLSEENERSGRPVNISIGFRTDRVLKDSLNDPDFQDIRAYKPFLDFTWSYTSAGNRITKKMLPNKMRLRSVTRKPEPCVNLFHGPIVLPNGDVLGCNCVAAMDAIQDLRIGNILEDKLVTFIDPIAWLTSGTNFLDASTLLIQLAANAICIEI